MNDFRWSPHMISWQKFLTFLDVHLTAPKSHFEQGIYVCNDITIFPTSIFPIWFVGRSSNMEGENAMMDSRWKMFHLSNSWFWTRKCNSVSKVFFPNVHFREWNFKLNVIQIFNKNVNTYWFCIACFALDINWQCFSQKMLCYSIVSKLTSIVFRGFQLF